MGVQFRMRYSIPLFTYGPTLRRREPDRRDSGVAQPALSWSIIQSPAGRYLQVRNDGPVHARLTDVKVKTPGLSSVVGGGLLGYVLPGAQMRWPLADDAPRDGELTLEAGVNGALPAALRR